MHRRKVHAYCQSCCLLSVASETFTNGHCAFVGHLPTAADDAQRNNAQRCAVRRNTCRRPESQFAAGLRRRRRRTGRHHLWRAVDQNGIFIDILVQRRRDRFAVMRFFVRCGKRARRCLRVIATHQLRCYAAARRIRGSSLPGTPAVLHVHGITASHFRPRRHLLSAADYCRVCIKSFRTWNEVAGAADLSERGRPP